MTTFFKVLLAGLVACAMAACVSQKTTGGVGNGSYASVNSTFNVDYPGYSNPNTKFKKGDIQTAETAMPQAFMAPVCTPGQHVGYNRDAIFIIDFTVRKESNLVTSIMNSAGTLAKAAPQIQHSKALNMSGSGFIRSLLNLGPELLPSRHIPFLVGDHICGGMATVEPGEGPGFANVLIPISGEKLGQAAIVLPRGPLLKLAKQFWPCFEAVGFETTLNVELRGRYAGRRNMKCTTGVPEVKDMTHAMYQLTRSFEGQLYVWTQP